ncbi:hypothetical protein A6M27_12025 [Acidithiobacillus thiooxidans]|uniref:Uncharacterized protein n=1 Tax=Acidithiobacillus thiooxidans TaxID=930 RepID=A0A1C2I6Y8_ACITH|nr:hypothetical protein A6O24_15115 [Acidithiobacillus thiooxidans]OCX73029.1 hypothetical protein A6P07_09020 [Acidithiobacillus thiooxidans]OCX78874.1 hypothetical protein A6O26_17560 [Acidithiobacillus thiooxidans]OCX86694.1 hypothetical protein A6M27_12025 [Acidithiobacillus thiooxidans]OFC44917.1 hypothetical protein BAE47_10975 [Acidithiobacillus thiooxidans]
MKKASPYSKPAPDKADNNTITTRAGRRGASSLWSAIRTLNGAHLTVDDVRILSGALGDLQVLLLMGAMS